MTSIELCLQRGFYHTHDCGVKVDWEPNKGANWNWFHRKKNSCSQNHLSPGFSFSVKPCVCWTSPSRNIAQKRDKQDELISNLYNSVRKNKTKKPPMIPLWSRAVVNRAVCGSTGRGEDDTGFILESWKDKGSGRKDKERQQNAKTAGNWSVRDKQGLWQVSWGKRRYVILGPACGDLGRLLLRASQGSSVTGDEEVTLMGWGVGVGRGQLAQTQLRVWPRVILQPFRTLIPLVSGGATHDISGRSAHMTHDEFLRKENGPREVKVNFHFGLARQCPSSKEECFFYSLFFLKAS